MVAIGHLVHKYMFIREATLRVTMALLIPNIPLLLSHKRQKTTDNPLTLLVLLATFSRFIFMLNFTEKNGPVGSKKVIVICVTRSQERGNNVLVLGV